MDDAVPPTIATVPVPVPHFPRTYRRGELLPDPATVEEAEQQAAFLRRAIGVITKHLAQSPDDTAQRTGMEPEEYAQWRERAERALVGKRAQLEDRELWLAQIRRQPTTHAHPNPDLLIARAHELLTGKMDDDQYDRTESTLISDLEAYLRISAYLRTHPAQTEPPLVAVPAPAAATGEVGR